MSWFNELEFDRSRLLPAAPMEAVGRIEQQFRCQLPADYKEFLLAADGGVLGDFILYSAGQGVHPDETLLAANERCGIEFPLLAVVRDATDEFGFKRSDLSAQTCPVYFVSHETSEFDRVADSFKAFVSEITSLRPGQPFVPPSRRTKPRWKLWKS